VTEQVLVPLQPAPDHPVNVVPLAGVAVRVTAVPEEYGAEHAPPVEAQLSMPAGLLATVPPVPDTTTVNIGGSFQLAGGVWSQGSPVFCVGGVGGVAQGLLTKSKNSFIEG
jgi:hypothetical protein